MKLPSISLPSSQVAGTALRQVRRSIPTSFVFAILLGLGVTIALTVMATHGINISGWGFAADVTIGSSTLILTIFTVVQSILNFRRIRHTDVDLVDTAKPRTQARLSLVISSDSSGED